MRRVWLGLAAAALLAPLSAHAQVDPSTGHGSSVTEGDFDDIRSDEEKRGTRAPEPVARTKYEAAVATLFAAADTNRDGTITVAEFQAIIAGRKEQAIQERFAAIDTNHDKSISYGEFSAWQHSLGSLALSDADAGGDTGIVAEEIRLKPGRGRANEMIAELLEPLRTTVIVAANTNYDAGASLAELTAYEDKRFDAVDTNHDGWITEDEWIAAHPGERGAGVGGGTGGASAGERGGREGRGPRGGGGGGFPGGGRRGE